MNKLNLRNLTLAALLILVFQNSYSQQNINGWYWVNGQPQSSNLNWVKIIDSVHYYAVGDNGTFMKSSDKGNSWLINTQAGVPDLDIGVRGTRKLLTGWFFDANTGLVGGESNFYSAGSGDGGKIRRTTDGGQTFSTIDLGNAQGSPEVYDIHFINSTTGFLCGTNAIKAFKTTNAGLNWTLIPNLPDSSYSCIYAQDENNLILGLGFNFGSRGIVRTTNGGVNWIKQTLPGTSSIIFTDIQFQNADTGFISGKFDYFAYTTNGGANWTKAVYPVTMFQGAQDLKIIGSTVYILGSYNSYYYTSNLGATWDSINYSDYSNPYQPGTTEVEDYSFDINGSDAIVAGYSGKVNVSNNGGANWHNKNYLNGSARSIFALPGTEEVWGCNGGYVLYSSNRGTNWVVQPTGAPGGLNDIDMLNSNTGYGVGGGSLPFFQYFGHSYKTTNGGVNWIQTFSFDQIIEFVDFVNADTGWCLSPPAIFKTTDGGSFWFNQAVNPPDLFVSRIDMFDANTGYAMGGSNVAKTTNGGDNWDIIDILPDYSGFKSVKAFPNNAVYVIGDHVMYKSFNGGISWDSSYLPTLPANIYENMDWTDLNNGIIVGRAGYTAKTSNGGLTWIERNTGTGFVLTGVSMASKDTVFTSFGGGILRLYDNTPNLTSINITVGIEGFRNGIAQVNDTVKCHLRNSISPFEEVEVAAAVTNNRGVGIFQFTNAPSGSYYLEITHRNSIGTWSALPQTVTAGGKHNYDFTASLSNAYGNNLILKSGKYCNYSGDVNQDGHVNLTDMLETSDKSVNFNAGYVPADVNGDNIVDLLDVTIVYNNYVKYISIMNP